MSGAARGQVLKHFGRALEAWPKDVLRPDCQLQDVLGKRLQDGGANLLGPKVTSMSGKERTAAELEQVNAVMSLLQNRYQSRYKIRGSLMQPRSNPKYYENLIKELDEAPTRSMFARIVKKLSGMFRV